MENRKRSRCSADGARRVFSRGDRILLAWPNLVVFCTAIILLYLPGAAEHPVVLKIVDIVETFTRAPLRYAELSNFPVETRAVIALSILMLLPQALVMARRWRTLDLRRKLLLEYSMYSPSRIRLLTWFGWPLIVAACVFGLFFAARDPSWCQGCVNDSKPGLLFFVLIGPPTLILAFLSATDWYRWRLSDRRL